MIIEDGTGTRLKLKIDNTQAAKTRSTTLSSLEEAAVNGDAYSIFTGTFTLTSDTASAIYFYKNQEDVDIVLTRSFFNPGSSTGGTTSAYTIQTFVGSTSMSSGSGNDLNQQNLRFGSGQVMTLSDSEIGIEGASFVGGTGQSEFELPVGVSTPVTTFIVIPKGVSVGLLMTPPPSNTSMTFGVLLNLHLIRAT